MRKKIVTMALAGVMAMSMAMPAFAMETPEWALVDASGYGNDSYNDIRNKTTVQDWVIVENLAQIRAWADSVSSDIKILATDKEKVVAAVNKVCDFLDYDYTGYDYGSMNLYFTVRDRKGVCANYVALTAALLEEVGVQYIIQDGYTTRGAHAWLKVSVEDGEYICDPTFVDTGDQSILVATDNNMYQEINSRKTLSDEATANTLLGQFAGVELPTAEEVAIRENAYEQALKEDSTRESVEIINTILNPGTGETRTVIGNYLVDTSAGDTWSYFDEAAGKTVYFNSNTGMRISE